MPHRHGVFYIAESDVRGEYVLYSYELPTQKRRAIATFRETPSGLPISVSPDGNRILY